MFGHSLGKVERTYNKKEAERVTFLISFRVLFRFLTIRNDDLCLYGTVAENERIKFPHVCAKVLAYIHGLPKFPALAHRCQT